MKRGLIGIAALALVSPAIAQVAAQAPASTPQAGRAQKPVKVHSRAQVQAKVAEHFARLDTDRDGFVTRTEADAARDQRADRIRERAGKRHEKAFDRLDADNDGAISKAEWDARSADRAQRIAKHDRDGDGRRDRRARFMRGMHGLGGHMFEMADANRDGRVSLQEAQATALRHFDQADVNRDGQITPEEHRQMRERMRNQHERG